MRLIPILLVVLGLLCNVSSVQGARDIGTIIKTGEMPVKVSIDVAGFRPGRDEAGKLFRRTLINDLKRSGWFSVVSRGNSSVAISGSCASAGGQSVAQCTVRNIKAGKTYLNKAYKLPSAKAAQMAHNVADDIVFALRGVPGMSSSKIVMVGMRGSAKDLYMCDSDGGNLKAVTSDGAVCLSPNWARAGRSIVYTSFVRGFPDVYEIDLATRERRVLARFPGLNTGADFAPDNKRVALTLSKDGNPELYVLRPGGGQTRRLTRTPRAAEASPSWSPDGRRIAFVSDRSGSPQVYVVDAEGGTAKRLTFRGNENVAPDWGANNQIVYSSRRSGQYQICRLDMTSGRKDQLTGGSADHEDPSWGPDLRHVVYTRTAGYRSELYVLDTLGDPPVRLFSVAGEWHSPAWSPR